MCPGPQISLGGPALHTLTVRTLWIIPYAVYQCFSQKFQFYNSTL